MFTGSTLVRANTFLGMLKRYSLGCENYLLDLTWMLICKTSPLYKQPNVLINCKTFVCCTISLSIPPRLMLNFFLLGICILSNNCLLLSLNLNGIQLHLKCLKVNRLLKIQIRLILYNTRL